MVHAGDAPRHPERADDWRWARGAVIIFGSLTWAFRAQIASLAKKNGTSHQEPSLEVLKRLARALGVPVTELLE